MRKRRVTEKCKCDPWDETWQRNANVVRGAEWRRELEIGVLCRTVSSLFFRLGSRYRPVVVQDEGRHCRTGFRLRHQASGMVPLLSAQFKRMLTPSTGMLLTISTKLSRPIREQCRPATTPCASIYWRPVGDGQWRDCAASCDMY